MRSVIEKILESAERVVASNGVPGLTLDAVAKHAGVSKGGLLHHFPSKNALLSALVKQHVSAWRADIMRAYDAQPRGPGRFARAMLAECLSGECKAKSANSAGESQGESHDWASARQSSCRVVLTAVIQDPQLVQPIRDMYGEIAKLIADDGLPPGYCDVVMAVTDAMWLYWICDIRAFDQSRLRNVNAALTRLITLRPSTKTKRRVKPKAVRKKSSVRRKSFR